MTFQIVYTLENSRLFHPTSGGLVQMSFLFKWVIFRFITPDQIIKLNSPSADSGVWLYTFFENTTFWHILTDTKLVELDHFPR